MRRYLRYQGQRRKGAAIVLAAFLMIALFAMVAFAVDLGYISLVKSQLQAASDCAAHAAMLRYFNPTGDVETSNIAERKSQGISAAQTYAAFKSVNGQELSLSESDVTFGSRAVQADGSYKYDWTATSGFNSVKVKTSPNANGSTPAGSLSLFFAPVMGFNSVQLSAESVAVLAPRDIVFVIDLSGSMHHDTEPWALNALNWLNTASDGTTGAGDYAMKQVWSDLGITESYVSGKGIDPTNTSRCWKMTSSSNKAFAVPTAVASSGTKSLSLQGVLTMISSAPFVTNTTKTTTSHGKTTTTVTGTTINTSVGTAANGEDFAQYASPSTDSASQRTVKAYDYIIDQVLPYTMPEAKPSLSSATGRDNFREYWRGYLNYSRGSDSTSITTTSPTSSGGTTTLSHGPLKSGSSYIGAGDGTSGGIDSSSFSNPATTMSYTNSAGTSYSTTTLYSDVSALVNRTDYMTYIQFMMDMSYDGRAGIQADGTRSTSYSNGARYNPMSENFDSDNGSKYTSADQARWTDSNGYTRFVREQPMGALIDGVISAIQQVQTDNPSTIPSDSRDHVSIALFGATAGLWCTDGASTDQTAPNPVTSGSYFTCDYDAAMTYVSQLQAEKCVGASTATYDGLTKASKAITNSGRTYSNKVVILFTDGVPNYGTTVSNVSPDPQVTIDGVTKNYYYSDSKSYLTYRNSALTGANSLYTASKTATVHTVAAGGGRDADVTERQAARTKGIFMDAGTDPYTYQTALINALEDVVQAKVPKLAVISSTDSEVKP